MSFRGRLLIASPLLPNYKALFVPLVKKLGYEYSATDSPDTTLLRTLAITHAAAARDKELVLLDEKNCIICLNHKLGSSRSFSHASSTSWTQEMTLKFLLICSVLFTRL